MVQKRFRTSRFTNTLPADASKKNMIVVHSLVFTWCYTSRLVFWFNIRPETPAKALVYIWLACSLLAFGMYVQLSHCFLFVAVIKNARHIVNK